MTRPDIAGSDARSFSLEAIAISLMIIIMSVFLERLSM